MQCQALTKSGKRCRGYGQHTDRPAAPLCHMHREFFTGDTPFELLVKHASIFQTWSQRKWFAETLASPHFSWKPEYAVKLNKLMLSRNWYERDKAAYIFDVLVRAKVLHPAAYPDLLARRLRDQSRTVLNSFRTNPSTIYTHYLTLELLAPYIDSGNLATTLPRLLRNCDYDLFSIHHPATQTPEHQRVAAWTQILNTLIPRMSPVAAAFYPCDQLIETIVRSHETLPGSVFGRNLVLQAHVKDLLQALQIRGRRIMQRRITPFKEELIARAWAPQRIAAALDAGLDTEDL